MRYGLQIGLKFDQGGKPLYYPGNTVIADVEKDNPAYDVIHQVHVMLDCEKLAKFFIFLPEIQALTKSPALNGINELIK